MAREEIVSNASEQLILVDDQDREIGFKAKTDCHTRQGRLASCVLDLRLQQRQRAAAAAAQPDQDAVARLLVEHVLLASAPRRVDGDGGHAAARAGARVHVPARVSVQVQVPGAVRRRGRRARALLGVLRPLRRAGRRERQRNRRLAVRRRRGARARARARRPIRSRRGSRWSGCTSRPTTSTGCWRAPARTAKQKSQEIE